MYPVPPRVLFMLMAGAAFSLVGVGCSSSASITGKVTYKGEAVKTGEIHFHGADGKSRSSIIATDGAFQIDDAPMGEVSVSIVANTLVSKSVKAPPSADGSDPPKLPPKIVSVSLVP